MVCRNFILPEICKPCLFLFTFQFAKLILPYPPVVFLIHYELLSANIKYANKKEKAEGGATKKRRSSRRSWGDLSLSRKIGELSQDFLHDLP